MGSSVVPKVFLLGETQIHKSELARLLQHLGAQDWVSDADNDVDELTEVYGRGCYKSFGTELNPNITKVRTTNREYLENTIAKGDGSIFEHVMTNWYFADVSRVFTHELVRHRVGVGISQESLRYVRLEDLNWFAPTAVSENETVMGIFERKFEQDGQLQRDLAQILEMDDEMSFAVKKKLTSAMRRAAPMGLATNIGWSANIRTLRHVIEQRTAPEAEEEMRWVFSEVARIACIRWPNVFTDYQVKIVDGFPVYYTEYKKI